MVAKMLDGKELSTKIKQNLKNIILKHNIVKKITLAVILVGEDPASKVYVKNKLAACEYVGINVEDHVLDNNSSQDAILRLIDNLNNNPNIHGILLQLPLPDNIIRQDPNFANYILEKIHPNKDVDGFHPYNIGRLAQRYLNIRPCTPKGIIKLLHHYNIPIKSKNITIVGASNIVGRPLALEMLIEGGTVTVCHKFTRNLKEHCLNADILCSAVGIPNLIKADYIKSGATIIDIGITRLADGSLAGDLEFDNASKIAEYITPVPGGVGPMTVAMLLENTIECYQLLTSKTILH